MKKTMILGTVTMEFRAKVPSLPKGNEEYQVKDTKSQIGGSGFRAMSTFRALSFPYEWNPVVGSGIYGEEIQKHLAHVSNPYFVSEDINGAGYRLIDSKGNEQSLFMPGAEYEFDREMIADINFDEIEQILLFGDMLCGDRISISELLEVLEEAQKEILFVPDGRLNSIETDVLEALYALRPAVCFNDLELKDYVQKECSLEDGAKFIYEKNQNDVIVLSQNEGVLYFDGKDMIYAERQSHYDACIFASLYMIALTSSLEKRQALTFAASYSNYQGDEMMDAYDAEEMKLHLKESITRK